jgi:hypothetical protein
MVLVIDEGLQDSRPNLKGNMLQIGSSCWARRLWTLQEEALAGFNLQIQIQDLVVPLIDFSLLVGLEFELGLLLRRCIVLP